jgi:hypothetical protein
MSGSGGGRLWIEPSTTRSRAASTNSSNTARSFAAFASSLVILGGLMITT